MRKSLSLLFILFLIAASRIINAQPITVIGHSSKFSSSSSVTINLPDSVQQGDFLLAHISLRIGSGLSIKADSGWTLLRKISSGGSAGVGMHIFYKIATASEPSTYAFSDSSGSSSSDKLGIISVYRGVDTLSPIDSEKGIALSSSPYSTPDDTTLTDSCMIVTLFGIRSTGTSSWTPPAGMTEEYDTSGAQSTRITGCGDYVIQPLAGATGQKTAIPSGGSGSVAAEIIALRPASIATNVHSPDNDFSFGIFPNPAGSWIEISGLKFEANEVIIELYNAIGERVITKKLQPQDLQTAMPRINVSALSKGLYFASIQTGKEVHIVRFVKD